VLGRPAPDPTEPNKNGNPRLTVAFDEWMMGLPEGWVDDFDIPYGAKIKLCGNGVVPQQAEIALRYLTMNEVVNA
jgi:DNA (cytosine-5)-methyltransferase 1